MDPISAASVAGTTVQFLTLAFAVSSRIQKYCKSASNVPTTYRELSTQIPLLAELFRDLQSDPTVNPDQRLEQVLNGCIRNLTTLNQILTKVLPERGDSVASKVLKALRSVGAEDKAKECKAELESYKTTLTLYLGAQASFKAAPPPPSPAYYHLPSLGRAKFVGRKDTLEAIDRVVKTQGRDTNVAVLLGMGGQGKTSLAIEYCRLEKTRSHFETILWINSISTISIQRSFAEIAKNILALSGEQRSFPNIQAQVTFVHTVIEKKGGHWLLVFDNYDWPHKVKNILDYAPNSARGAAIMTTRHADVAPLGTLIPVDGMSEADAVELLLERTGHARTIANLTQSRAVVKLLGYLPLAIDQSAAYIRSRKISPEDFLDHYKNRKEKILKDVPSIWEYQRSLGGDGNETPLSVFTTWEMSFLQALEHSPIGDCLADFLSTLAFFAPLYVRMEMFQAYFEGLQAVSETLPPWIDAFAGGPKWDKFGYQDTVVFLADLSLVRYSGVSTSDGNDDVDTTGFCTLSLHPLVRDWIQLRIPTSERRARCIEALLLLSHYIKAAGIDYCNWPLKIRLQALSHVDASLELQAKYARERAGGPMYQELRAALKVISTFYADNGRYKEAERICKDVLHADTKVQRDNTEIACTQVQLTDIFLLQGRYRDVEETIWRLLSSDTAFEQGTKLHMSKNLARSLFKQGRYDESVTIYNDILRQQAIFLPTNDLDVLNTRELLAQVYRNQGQHEKAIELYDMVLAGYRAEGLASHLEALHCMVNLANTYRAQARYDLATTLYEKASLEVAAKLHADHPTALSTKMFMAINLRELQRYEDGEEAFRDVIERSARVLGLQHPDTLKATMNYAILCDRWGKVREAEELYRTTLEGREKKLGVDNPYTLRTVERLVSLLWNSGRLEEALEISARTLSAQKRKSHTDQLLSGLTLEDVKDSKYRPVETLFERAVARDMEALDEAHRDRIESQKSLATIYRSQGRDAEAKHYASLAQTGEDVLRERLGVALRQRMDSDSTLVPPGAGLLSYEDAVGDPSPPYSEGSD
jgi:tetratricopeptide (TPR) repeat protein